MKRISNAITGAGLLISGTLILNFILSCMDWSRIDQYGFFHELALKDIAPYIFMVGSFFMIIGLICLVMCSF